MSEHEDTRMDSISDAFDRAYAKAVAGARAEYITRACHSGVVVPHGPSDATVTLCDTPADIMLPVAGFSGPITYSIVSDFAEMTDTGFLETLFNSLQTGHLQLKKDNRVDVLVKLLDHYHLSVSHKSLKTRLKADERLESSVCGILTEPVLNALMVLGETGSPETHKAGTITAFTSNATADSGNACPFVLALQLLQPDLKIGLTATSMVHKDSHMTGISNMHAHDKKVFFQHDTPLNDWAKMSYDIATQFYIINGDNSKGDKSKGDLEYPIVHQYDVIYHWGCIAQNFQRNSIGHDVSSWMLHEEWNLLLQIAMMWHAVATLKPGGALYVKARMFTKAETLGVVALLAIAFQNVRLIPLITQSGSSIAVVYATGCLGDDDTRYAVMDALHNAMTLQPSGIFLADVVKLNSDKFKSAMVQCEKMREYIMKDLAIRNTLFLTALFHLAELGRENITEDECRECLCKLFRSRYCDEFVEQLATKYITGFTGLRVEKRAQFMAIVGTRWMK